MPTPSQPKCYNPRHPERTLLYQTVAEHYETWHDLASAGRASQLGRRRTWGRRRTPNPGQACSAGAAQAPGALPTGGEGVEGSDVEPNWDEAAQLVPDFEVDQRISW